MDIYIYMYRWMDEIASEHGMSEKVRSDAERSRTYWRNG